MKRMLASETLKLKRSGTLRLAMIIPFVTLFIAFLMGGMQIFAAFSIYWWEAGFLFLLISLLFLYDKKSEEKAGNFQNVNSEDLSWKIHLVKMLLIWLRGLIASLVLAVLLYLVAWIFQGIVVVDFMKVSVALLVILLAAAWNLPLLYVLSKWFNTYVLIAANSLLCLIVAPFIAQTPIWFLLPYTYHYKVVESLLHIKPAGDLLEKTVNFNIWEVLLPIGLSIVVTIGLSYVLKGVLEHDKK
ncbi:lantibiotic ABC transporter permease [Lactococcus lactis]|uniref:lantibiotic ABC transporter permease n=1 Tax=Lactococcus lactis TaxID=1358 RepID=UPI001111302B|nr:lantibiotic ABC transporter permease [Lactococcus lactis]